MVQQDALLRYILFFISGALATLAFAPFNLPVFSIISVAGAYLLLQSPVTDRSFFSGWSFGSGYFGAGTSWVFVSIYYHSNTPLFLAIVLTLMFVVGLGLLFAVQFWSYRRLFKQGGILGFGAIWMLFEWLRSWLFTGFPWLYVGYAWIDTPLAHLAPLGGVWLVSTAVVLIALLIAQSLLSRNLLPLAGSVAILVTGYLIPTDWTRDAGAATNVLLVQPNIDQEKKWNPAFYSDHLRRLESLSLYSKQAERANWIIWPETAIPKLIHQGINDLDPFLAKLEKRNQVLIAGFPMHSFNPSLNIWTYQNAMGVLTAIPSIYQKQRLVPFGEYLPFENQLRGIIDFFNLPMSTFSLPRTKQSTLKIDAKKLAAAICYEIAYPELVRAQAIDSDMIITLSNDTWFGGSHGPDQHLQIARMRALENGRWLIRNTNNGLTAVIAPDGSINAQLPRGEEDARLASVFSTEGQTPFQRWGLWPAMLINLAFLLAGLLRARRRFTLK